MNPLLSFLRRYLSPPVFQDEEQTRIARIVHITHQTLILASLVGIFDAAGRFRTVPILLLGNAIALPAYWLNRRGRSRLAGFILLTIMLSAVTALLLAGNGIHDIAITALPVILIPSAMILGRRGSFLFAALVISATGFVVFAEINHLAGFDINIPTSTQYSDFLIVASLLTIVAVSSQILINQLAKSFTRTRLSDARVRALVEYSPDIILEIDRSGKIVFVNRHRETYLGKNLREVLPPDQLDPALAVVERAFLSGEPQAGEYQTITPDGQVSWDSIRVGPVKSGDQTTSLTIIMTDITAQKEAERRVHESEERYRLISSVTSDYAFSTQIDGEGNMSINWVAGAFEAMTGYTPDEYKANGGWLAHVYPDDVEKDLHALEQLKANQSVTHEIRIITKLKKIRWVQVYAHPIRDENSGQLVGIVGAVQDITERKQAEEKIRQSNSQLVMTNQIIRAISELTDLKSVLEIIRQQIETLVPFDLYSVRIFNETDRTVSYPAVYESGRYWEEPETELIPGTSAHYVFETGNSVLVLMNEDELEQQKRSTYPSIGDRSKTTASLIFVPLKIKGKTIGAISIQRYQMNAYTEEHLKLMEDVALQATIAIENARLFTGMQQELAQRERAEAELHKSASRLKLLLDIDRALLSTRTPTEIAREALTRIRQLIPSQRASINLFDYEINMAFYLVSSYEGDFDPVGRSAISLQEYGQYIIDELLQDKACRVDDVLADPRCNDLDRSLANAGYRAWLFLPLLYQGQLIGALNLGRASVTAFTSEEETIAYEVANQLAVVIQQGRLREALERELAERMQVEEDREKLIEELEARNAELERFTYTVSHDLKSPIITIAGFLGYLESDALAGDTERLRNDIARIQHAAQKMKTLLDELLRLSRVGRVMNPPEDVSFEDVVRQSLELVSGRLDSRHVRVTVAGNLPMVHGDRARLIEVILNLVDNAAKFMGDQPEPVIEIGQHGEENGKPVFYVRDNGIGIRPEFHEKIFGLFNKLDPRVEGTGIGLALVKRIVEFHGGRIWVEADWGKGSTFFFTLPKGSEAGAGH